MKKILVGFLCATNMMFVAVPAFAAETSNALISPAPSAAVTQKSPAMQYILKINGKNIDLGTLNIVKMEEQIMVPLRITSEVR